MSDDKALTEPLTEWINGVVGYWRQCRVCGVYTDGDVSKHTATCPVGCLTKLRAQQAALRDLLVEMGQYVDGNRLTRMWRDRLVQLLGEPGDVK